MKTASEWVDDHSQSGPFDLIPTCSDARELVLLIQKDALSNSMASPADQQELKMLKETCNSMEENIEFWKREAAKMREKWLGARKHLRAANKGAERNAKALDYCAARSVSLDTHARRHRDYEERKHETIVWNWLLLSDEDYRLKCGELSSQDLRNIRAVLKAMLGTKIFKL